MTVISAMACPARADWLTAPSFYTHDPATGERTHRYAAPPQTPVPPNPSYRTSGMHHFRSSLQFGPSADHYHRVEQWGPPIQPYGEWRFPFRPYSVPYDQWGAPFAGLNLGFGRPIIPVRPFPGGGRPPAGPGGGAGGRPGANPGVPRPGVGSQPGYFPPGSVQPWQPQLPYPDFPYSEGEYRDSGAPPRLNDRQFYYQPNAAQP